MYIGQRESILLAAADLSGWFSATQLLIAAWRLNPAVLSLDGDTTHPSDHKLSSHLCGAKGLVRQGLLERDARGMLRTTPFGLEKAAALRGAGQVGQANGHHEAPREEPPELRRLLTHRALLLDVWGQFREIDFDMALDFWGWVRGGSSDELKDRIEHTTENLRTWRESGDGSEGQLNLLASLHDRLVGKYGRKVEGMRGK